MKEYYSDKWVTRRDKSQEGDTVIPSQKGEGSSRIPLQYKVIPIQYEHCKDWLLHKHYAKRIPSICYAFGLYDSCNVLQGVITFGSTANYNLNEIIGGYENLELNRLVVNDNLKRGVLSYFVSQSLDLLPKPLIIISYADTGHNHCGYIYQATNWIYTGLGKGDYEFVKDGKQYHRKNIFDQYGTGSIEQAKSNGYEVVIVQPKHRYFKFLGTHKQVKEMKTKLRYPILPYPKGDNKRYDASYEPQTQGMLC